MTRAECERKARKKYGHGPYNPRCIGTPDSPPIFGDPAGPRCQIRLQVGPDEDSILGEGMTWEAALKDADRRAKVRP